MALIHHDTLTGPLRPQTSVVTHIAGATQAAAAAVMAWHRNRQTQRQIEAMPADMRKDFGWPAADRALPQLNKS